MSPPALERKSEDIRNNPDFTLLFDDPRAEAIRYFRKTGIYPPQHTTAVRESVLHEHPWVAMSLLNAFEEAKQIAIGRMRHQTLFVFTALEVLAGHANVDVGASMMRVHVDTTLWPAWVGLALAGLMAVAAAIPYLAVPGERTPSTVAPHGRT